MSTPSAARRTYPSRLLVIALLGIVLLAVSLTGSRGYAQDAAPTPPSPVGGPGEGPPLVATSVEALAEALRSTGLDVVLTDTAAIQPWIPEPGVQVRVAGALVDVFVLSGPDAVSSATATRKNGPLSVQPPSDVAVWLNGAAFIMLHDAPNHPQVRDAITSLIGPPQFTTIAGPQPPPPPAALPATGSGGLAGETGAVPYRAWGLPAASLVLLIALGSRVKSHRRRSLRSPVDESTTPTEDGLGD